MLAERKPRRSRHVVRGPAPHPHGGKPPWPPRVAGWTTTVYVGHPHGQTDRYIEVIMATRPPREALVFHVMELSDLYRHLAD